MDHIDYKKLDKALYSPSPDPELIDVPAMRFIQIDGKGDPNDIGGEYPAAIELLYALCYTIKMSPKSDWNIANYFSYVVPPLEGLWWFGGQKHFDFASKSKFCWTSMIRQPEFVTDDVFSRAKVIVKKKKPQLDVDKARIVTFCEGLCVQCMHIGVFDDEPVTLARMEQYIKNNNLTDDISDVRRHHEIYLSDPRKTNPSRMKTVLRHPIRR